MSVLQAIAPPMSRRRAGRFMKTGFYTWSLVFVISSVCAFGPSVVAPKGLRA
jgi:hypothetical protein